MAIQIERQDRKQEHRMKGKGIHSRSIFVQLVVFSLLASSMILTIVLFAMTTASMMGVNTIFVNFFPLRYEAIGKVSTVSGFMNGMAYVGTAVSTFTIGVLVEQKGWNVTIGSWGVMTFLALVVCMLGRKKFS